MRYKFSFAQALLSLMVDCIAIFNCCAAVNYCFSQKLSHEDLWLCCTSVCLYVCVCVGVWVLCFFDVVAIRFWSVICCRLDDKVLLAIWWLIFAQRLTFAKSLQLSFHGIYSLVQILPQISTKYVFIHFQILHKWFRCLYAPILHYHYVIFKIKFIWCNSNFWFVVSSTQGYAV